MSTSQEQPERSLRRRASACARRTEPVVTTTSAERYVMSGGRASRLAIKEGDLFLYTNELGQVPGTENSALGLYYRDTRYLSRLRAHHRRPPAGAAHRPRAERGYAATVELTNLEARTADGHTLPQASVHVRRTRFVSDRLYELLRVRNYHHARGGTASSTCTSTPTSPTCSRCAAAARRRRGTRLAPQRPATARSRSRYLGLDEVARQTVIRFHDRPESIKQGRARYRLRLPPGERAVHPLRRPGRGARTRRGEAGGEFNAQLGALRHEHERWESDATDIFTDNEQLNRGAAPRPGRPAHAGRRHRRRPRAARRAALVRGALRSRDAVRRPRDPAPRPALGAGGGRRSWAAARARHDSAFREEQPGKIMHELRRGELASLRAIPHTPYFGSVDATPLWLLLVAELDHVDRRPRRVRAAAATPSTPRSAGSTAYGDADGDGFVEYERRSRAGLRNQGWRDASDAVLHADGTPAAGPIALAETQGYVYYAKRRLAAVYGQLGDVERAERLTQEAARAQARASTSASGWRTRASSPWRSTARSARCAPSARPSATRCGRGSSPTSTSPAVVRAPHGARHVHRLGHPHASARRRAATTR